MNHPPLRSIERQVDRVFSGLWVLPMMNHSPLDEVCSVVRHDGSQETDNVSHAKVSGPRAGRAGLSCGASSHLRRLAPAGFNPSSFASYNGSGGHDDQIYSRSAIRNDEAQRRDASFDALLDPSARSLGSMSDCGALLRRRIGLCGVLRGAHGGVDFRSVAVKKKHGLTRPAATSVHPARDTVTAAPTPCPRSAWRYVRTARCEKFRMRKSSVAPRVGSVPHAARASTTAQRLANSREPMSRFASPAGRSLTRARRAADRFPFSSAAGACRACDQDHRRNGHE